MFDLLGTRTYCPTYANRASKPTYGRQPYLHIRLKAPRASETPWIAPLVDWITAAGGCIHPALAIAENAPSSGVRGVVASSSIPLEELETGPLISVPQQLQFSSKWALSLIEQQCSPAAAATAAGELSDTQIIAAALAHELNAGSSSFWHPYLQSLPQHPPNPWFLSDPGQVAACIEPYKGSKGAEAVADWPDATALYRQQMLEAAAEVEQLLGHALNISADQVLVALGHVASRSLTSSSSSGLVPYIDLINHAADARPPMLQLADNDQLVMTVLPIRNDEAVPLAAGEELLISYQGGYTPIEAFLKFGFVADEWWKQ